MSKEEGILGDFAAEFKETVSFCTTILQRDHELRDMKLLRAQFGMGIIMILYFCPTRCRDAVVQYEGTLSRF